MKHCCYELSDSCQDPRVPIFYWPIFREYYVALSGGYNAKEIIKYCPFCSKKFPKSVRDDYYEILGDGMENDLPDEFHGEAWWRNRNL